MDYITVLVIFVILLVLTILIRNERHQREHFVSDLIPASFFHRFKTLLADVQTQTPRQKKAVISAKSDEFTLSLTLSLDKIPQNTVNLCFFTDKANGKLDPVSRSPGIWLSNRHVILGLGGDDDTVDLFHLNTPPKIGLNHFLFIFQENRCLFYYNGTEQQVCAFKNPPHIYPNLVVGPVREKSSNLTAELAPDARLTIQYLDTDLEPDSAPSLYQYSKGLVTITRDDLPKQSVKPKLKQRKPKRHNLVLADKQPELADKQPESADKLPDANNKAPESGIRKPKLSSKKTSQFSVSDEPSIDLADIESVKML